MPDDQIKEIEWHTQGPEDKPLREPPVTFWEVRR